MNNEGIHKLDMKSKDIVEDNISKISELFPDCISEGKIDFDMLKQDLSKDIIDNGKEKYQLTWVGKKGAIVNANTPCNKTLRPLREKSVDFDNTKNIYIEGDNLEVLKILQESYLNKIDCIYIDPPYNTGNDFIYNDDFKKNNSEELYDSGLTDGYGNKMISNTQTNGRFHSDWLSMMYPRLKLARNLLNKNGFIFISIDDNEYDNLKKICDEIFSPENYIATYIKQSKVGGGSDSKFVVKEHEYCLIYAKNYDVANEMFIAHDEEYLKRYKEEDKNGRYFWDTFARPGLKNPIHYEITAPDGTKLDYGWIHSKERFKQELKDGIVRIVQKNNGSWSVQFKQYLNVSGKKPRSMTMDFGGSIEGKNDIKELFNNDKIFNYPKSVKFLKTLFSTISNKNPIILDFFSGSATTAQAVMQLNSEDNNNRNYIMVQVPDLCDEKSEAYKEGYKTICNIGEERIRRAGKKIKEETNANIDYGFRVYKVDSSNMKDVYYAPTDLQQSQLNMFESNIKEDRTSEDLLTQVILDLGLTLDLSIEERKIINNNVYFVENNSLVACFDDTIDINIVDEICKCNPLKIVFKESSFKTDSDKINVFERIKKLSNDTEINII